MLRLCSKNIYLAALEKEHCRKLWEEYEYDFQSATEPLNIGHSNTKADSWFEEIQRDQGIKHIRLGVFLLDGTVIGDVALPELEEHRRPWFHWLLEYLQYAQGLSFQHYHLIEFYRIYPIIRRYRPW
jgi:hypothetical protein